MKRKLDFVTNSSSCAFIFIGWVVDTGDRINEIVKEQMEIFWNLYAEYAPKGFLKNIQNCNSFHQR